MERDEVISEDENGQKKMSIMNVFLNWFQKNPQKAPAWHSNVKKKISKTPVYQNLRA